MITHNLYFNDYLQAPIPNTEGFFLEVNLEPGALVFLPNTPFTRWFGLQEGIQTGTMVPHNKDGPVTLSNEQRNSFAHSQYGLSIRYAISYAEENNCVPIVDIRVIQRTQTSASAFLTTLDVATMSGGYIPVNILRKVFQLGTSSQ